MSIFSDPFWPRCRRLLCAFALLTVPACGLSDYEKLMDETQKREQRFRDEKRYLDEPVKIPTRKDKEGHDIALADAFFRPPKGIQSTGKEETDKFWHYHRSANSGNFVQVALAFATDNNTFLEDVERVYPRTQQSRTPQWTTPLPFDSWEYDEQEYTYTVNVSRDGGTRIAVVFIVAKGNANNLRKNMEVSLQSLAVDRAAVVALQRYNQKSPWQLEPKGKGGNG